MSFQCPYITLPGDCGYLDAEYPEAAMCLCRDDFELARRRGGGDQ